MELDRFHEARWYHGRTPLKELSFLVHVWRAPIQDEENKELMCKHRVTWNDKIQSPLEKIGEIRQYLQFQAQQQAVMRQGEGGQLASTGSSAVEQLLHEIKNLPGATCAEQLNVFAQTGSNMFFTYPTAADFINLDEERSPVEPEQPVTPLTQAVLRRHQREHQPSRTMFLMLSIGGAVCPPLQDANNPQNVRWVGREYVVCCLTSTEDETAFIAKPCLSEVHTLLVDGRMIWTFQVEAVEGAVTAPQPSLARPEITEALRRVGSSVSDHNVFASRDENERRTLLRQVINGRKASGVGSVPTGEMVDSAGGLLSRHAAEGSARVPFTPDPPYGEARFHFMGTVRQSIGVAAGTLRAKLEFLPPTGSREDKEENSKAGLTQATEVSSQLCYAARINDQKSCAPETIHVFNLPFEFHCVQSPLSCAPVRIAVTLTSQGPGGESPETVEGYGCITLSNLPGTHKVEIPLWRPKLNGREYLKSLFVGGSPSLVNVLDIAHQQPLSGVSAKTGLQVESVGVLKVDFMTIAQVWNEQASDKGGSSQLKERRSSRNLVAPSQSQARPLQ